MAGSGVERPRVGGECAGCATSAETLLVAAIALAALVAAPTAAADYADEQALAERHAPVVRVVEQTEECGHGEPFIPTDIDLILDEPTVALRGPWNRTDLVKIAPVGQGSRRSLRVPPRLPGRPARPGLRLRALGETTHGGKRAGRLRARRDGTRAPGQGLAPVLVLLPVQRLQQHARRRLGDDPARLRRERCRRGARSRSGGGWLQRARGGNALGTGRTTSSRSWTGRDPSSTPPPARTRTSTRLRSGSGAPPRLVSAATTRKGRTGSSRRKWRPSRAIVRPPRLHIRGLRSRGAGESCRRRSSTARPART